MTDYPGEQFPPAVDPDVEPQPEENPEPDYDTEPAREEVPSIEQAFEASLEEGPAESLDEGPAPSFEETPAPADSAYDGEAADSAYRSEAADEGAHPLVEETMGRLDELRERPVAEHAEVYADLHERLQSALVEADAEHGDRG